jgi:hypothetical protein
MITKDQFMAILGSLQAGNVVSVDFSGSEKCFSGEWSVVGSRIGRGRGGVLYVKLRARNGTEFELSGAKHGSVCESITVGYGPVEIAVVSKVASKVGRTSRLPMTQR